MGMGTGREDDRAVEAAQQAITSPLLDNVSIAGSTGVLVNITGGEDMTLGEVNQISEVIHDAAGDHAEIIFGAVNDPAMAGEIRVTVIATGFDKPATQQESPFGRSGTAGVLPFPQQRGARASKPFSKESPAPKPATPDVDISEMEIPTFIRRQMD
jgi:cell division protein FtsZ